MTTPEGLDATIHTREIVFDADVSVVTPFLRLHGLLVGPRAGAVRTRTGPRI